MSKKKEIVDAREQFLGLCHRCEYRAQYKENGRGPRFECGQSHAIHHCFMYLPVKPITIARSDFERKSRIKRPIYGPPIISARVSRVRSEKMAFKAVNHKDGSVLAYWVPKK